MSVDQAQIDAANLNIEYARITSPINGRVGLRLGRSRQLRDSRAMRPALSSSPQLDPISVVFSTPEDNLPRITRRFSSGEKLTAEVYDRANVKKLADGELTTFDNVVDTTTGTFKLRATFPTPTTLCSRASSSTCACWSIRCKGVVLVPNAAVQLGADGSYVYLVGDNSAVSVRKVKTGPAGCRRAP